MERGEGERKNKQEQETRQRKKEQERKGGREMPLCITYHFSSQLKLNLDLRKETVGKM